MLCHKNWTEFFKDNKIVQLFRYTFPRTNIMSVYCMIGWILKLSKMLESFNQALPVPSLAININLQIFCIRVFFLDVQSQLRSVYCTRGNIITPSPRELHRLIRERIHFELALFVNESLNKTTRYLSNLLSYYTPQRFLRSTLDITQLNVSQANQALGQKEFSVAGPCNFK